MALIKRTWLNFYLWMKKNRPSGVVSGWMIFFIVSYIVITKLDATGKGRASTVSSHNTRTFAYENVRKRTHKLPSRYGAERTKSNTIPQKILDDFAKDHSEAERNIHRSYGGTAEKEDDSKDEPVIDLSASDNEMMLFHEMEGREEEINEHWNNYLDKNKNVVNMKPNKHMRFQGVKTPSKRKVILPKLPKNVKVFDALSEGKKFGASIAENKCVLLKTMHGDSPICIHDPEDDEIISSYLFEHGAWEPNFLYITGSILKLEPELLFLDLGCNVGVYTILAAKLGKTVVAVDPNKQNLRLLTKSLSLGNIRDRVTLLLNAISDKHENVSLVEIVGNIGGTFVDSADAEKDSKELETVTITLDDLSDLFRDKPVFIKMDIETYEWKALEGGSHFFNDVDVRYILMEWIAHRGTDTGKLIIDFLTEHDLYPHVNNHHNTKLEPENSHAWPDNVLWVRY